MKNLKETLSYLSFLEIRGETDINYLGIAYNSEKVKENSLFVAIRGTNVDGHRFIPDAIAKGASVILCEEFFETNTSEITVVKVRDTRIALAELAKYWNDDPGQNLKFIGITGTNGKTTTAFLIQSLLKKIGKRVAVIGTTGIYLEERKIPATHTTPESLELYGLFREIADSGIEYVVMEVSSHSLVQNRIWGINFDAAIFTNLTHDHLDFHKTLENYAEAKKILFDGLKENAVAIVNADDAYGNKMLKDCISKNKYLISRSSESTLLQIPKFDKLIRIQNEKVSFSGISFNLSYSEGTTHLKIKTHLIGKFNIDNITFAIATISGLGLPLPDLHEDTSYIKGASGRMEVVPLPNGAIGVIDYAHTPDALEKALQTLLEIRNNDSGKDKSDGRIICIFGCGGDRDKEKRPIMGRIASELADCVILTSDNPRSENQSTIIDEIFQGISLEFRNKAAIIPNRKEAIQKAYKTSLDSDIILIAGKGHEDYQIIGSEKSHFDDKEELINSFS